MPILMESWHKCLSNILMFYLHRRNRLYYLRPQCCFALYQILQYVYYFYKVVNNQILSLRQGVKLLREYINIFINVTYLHIQDIQFDSITLYKGKMLFKNICLEQAIVQLK